MTYQGQIVENTYIAPAYGLVEYIKRARHDYMSIYTPEMHDRSLLHFKRGFSNTFLVNKPEYIEHVFLTNQQNYLKTPLAQPLLPPYLGVTLLTSEGEYWRRQRRTAAPAFQPRRVGDFFESMTASTEAMLQEWGRRGERPFDVVKQMTDLTLQIIARAMFSTDVSGEIETLTRMRHVVDEELKISVLDLLGLPQWLPRPVSKRALDSPAGFPRPRRSYPGSAPGRWSGPTRPDVDAARRARSRDGGGHDRCRAEKGNVDDAARGA